MICQADADTHLIIVLLLLIRFHPAVAAAAVLGTNIRQITKDKANTIFMYRTEREETRKRERDTHRKEL